jgi:hypothetical protein
MWLRDNFNLVMISGLTLILGLSYMGARKTHKEIKKGDAEWVFLKKDNKNKIHKKVSK